MPPAYIINLHLKFSKFANLYPAFVWCYKSLTIYQDSEMGYGQGAEMVRFGDVTVGDTELTVKRGEETEGDREVTAKGALFTIGLAS